MGCAAVCGSSSSVAENNKEWEALFLTLLTQTIPNPYLYPSKQLTFFKKQAELTPHRLALILPQKLQQNFPIPSMIAEKWKILLYTLDFGQSKFIQCLGYSHLIVNLHQQTHTNTFTSNNQLQNCQKDNSSQGENSQSNIRQFTVEIRPHKVFSQIHKDIQRSFPHVQFNHEHFSNILKRIANTFPVMGYTQGINFIVGYLLIIGYSQFDTYYLFLHLALNHRYLILGLYEDNFPLINIYISIFRNILKRTNQKLFNHLYHKVEMLQESIWIFKWFMTLYLSSFPMEMCMHVFDFMLCTDSTALIKFAIGLVLELEDQLMGYDDACDIAQFFEGMKQLERFNELVNIRRVVKTAYKIKIDRQDLEGINNLGDKANGQGTNLNNFYSDYIGVRFGQVLGEQRTRTPDSHEDQDNNNHNRKPIEVQRPFKESVHLLDAWYTNLTKQRLQFFNKLPSNISQSNIQPSQEIVEQPVTNLTESIIILQHSTSPPKIPSTLPVPLPNFSAHTSTNIQVDGKMKVKNSFSRCSIKKHVKQQLMWDNQEEQQYKQESQDKMEMEDEFFYMAKDIRFKRKKVDQQPNDILSEYSNPQQSHSKVRKQKNFQSRHELSPRTDELRNEYTISKNTKPSTTNNHNIHYSNTCSRLAYVGNSIISNLSASNSNRSSTSSHKVNDADVENNIRNLQRQNEGRHVKTKIRTEEKTLEFRNFQQGQNPDTNTQKRMSSFIDWMINSQGPHQNSNNLGLSNVKQMSDAGSEVQIKGMHMFKKKNKIDGDQKEKKRIRGRQQDNEYVGNMIQKQGHGSESKFEYKGQSKGNGFNDEESCESFFIGNASSRKSQICEVESVK